MSTRPVSNADMLRVHMDSAAHLLKECLRLQNENEQLRALVDDCENRMYHDSFRIDYDGGDEMEKEDAELRAIQQRAKALGIKVNE